MSDTPEIAIASPDVIATEMARRKLLSAMGISVYSSRFDFPGAAKAKRLSLPMAGVSEWVGATSVAQQPFEKAKVSARQTPPARGGGSVTSAQVVPSKAPASEAVSFSMLLASAGSFLWLEELADGLIRQDQLALINAMARAISPSATQVMQQQFDWPVAGNSTLSGDAESAKQALHGLIQRMAREVDAKRVILMGDCGYLPERTIQSAVQIPSSLKMLSEPTLKREAWEALKPLKSLSLG